MALYLSPIANDQQMDANGDPLVGGKIYTYLAGSTTPVATYTDSTGGTAQANPIILNSLGVPLSPIWLTGGVSYKFVIKTAADVTLRTIDGVTGINDVSSTAQEWNESGFVPTYISATQFSVPGDQTSILQVNRRLRNRVTAGYAYGRISVSSFAAGITTVTMVNDSTPLDSGLSSIAYGFLSFSPSSVPYALYAAAGANIDITSLNNGLVSNLPSVASLFKNLQASASGSGANITVSADELVLSDSSNRYVVGRALSLTVAGTSVGANGLDAGTLATSTWYSLWVIWNGIAFAGLLSLSAAAPTLPSGYTHKARVGWVRTDGTANKYPLSFIQNGRKVRYKVAGNVAGLPQMASGAAGAVDTPTWVAVAWANFAPTTAAAIGLLLMGSSGNGAMVAPNNSYGVRSSTTNPPPMVAASIASASNTAYDMVPESSNIYWASATTAALACYGWEDNL